MTDTRTVVTEIDGKTYKLDVNITDEDIEVVSVKHVSKFTTSEEDGVSFDDKYTPFPPKDEISYSYYCQQVAQQWVNSEFDFSECKDSYDNMLTEGEKNIFNYAISSLIPMEGVIINSILYEFLVTAPTYDAKSFLIVQAAIETTHGESYGLMMFHTAGREKLLEIQEEMNQPDSFIRLKSEFLEKYMGGDYTKSQKLFAFGCSEGIHLSSLFVIPFYFGKHKNILPKIAEVNELIAKDEKLHQDFSNTQIKLIGELTYKQAEEILLDAVEREDRFWEFLYSKGKLDGISLEDGKRFIRIVANVQMYGAGFGDYYDVVFPESLSFMQSINLVKKGNFYERLDTNYSKGSVKQMMERWNPENKGNPIEDFEMFDF